MYIVGGKLANGDTHSVKWKEIRGRKKWRRRCHSTLLFNDDDVMSNKQPDETNTRASERLHVSSNQTKWASSSANWFHLYKQEMVTLINIWLFDTFCFLHFVLHHIRFEMKQTLEGKVLSLTCSVTMDLSCYLNTGWLCKASSVL